MIDLTTFNTNAKYVIFDDFEFKMMPNKKCWWGAQQEFTVTDRYTRKKTISWGKPMIYLANADSDPSHDPLWSDWFDNNCIRVVLYERLY